MTKTNELEIISNKIGLAIDGHSSGMVALSLITILSMIVKDTKMPLDEIIQSLTNMAISEE
jgi:hypothetical protein